MFRRPFKARLIGSRQAASTALSLLKTRFKQGVLWGGAALALAPLLFIVVVIIQLPPIDSVRNLTPAQSTTILDRNGVPLYVIHGEENRTTVPLQKISSFVPQATLAIEDDQFYQHGGFDVGGLLKAICHEVYLCPDRRGGSTITQQFIKNAFLSRERSYARKLKELILAVQLESRFTKDQILEMYLNRIPYGSNTFGAERASNTFFGKSAADLTLAEASVLAALPQAPTYYSPYGDHLYTSFVVSPEELVRHGLYSEEDIDPELISSGLLGKTYSLTDDTGKVHSIYLKGRTNLVLDRMLSLGLIAEAQHTQALEELSTLVFKPYREEIKAPHFVMYVRQLLESQYGKEQVEKGGLRVTTTLDADLQIVAEEAVARYAEMNETRYQVTNEGLVALDPVNGQVLAMVGSRDYWNDEIQGKNNMALAPRLPGSSFKPIVYATAFMQGYAPSTVVYDVKTKFGDTYEPENYDGKEHGPVSFRTALAHSLNIPAVKAAYLAGVPNVLALARNLGLRLNQPDDWYGLSLALGAGEVRLIDLVSAYAVFGNGGMRVEPVVLLKAEDKDGNILEEYTPPPAPTPILDPQVAYLVSHVLSDPQAKPEGFWRDQLTVSGQVNAAKTGTSNKQKPNPHYNPSNPDSKPTVNVPFDTWTVGYTTRIAAGVWAGNADGKELGPTADGLGAASRIWRDFMTTATRLHAREEFKAPPGIKWIQVSKLSGKLPSEHTPPDMLISEPFASFAPPKAIDDSYQVVTIDKVSGKLATEYTPEGALEQKAFYVHHSEFPDRPEWEEPVQRWATENNQNAVIPTAYDDVHTPETLQSKPDIRIVSPVASGTVSPPALSVRVEAQAVGGVKKVEYTWDDILVYTADKAPFSGLISIPAAVSDGSRHVIGAKAFDSLYRTGYSSVEVIIGPDTVPPIVSITYPPSAGKIYTNSMMSVRAEATDYNSVVQQVDFYLDDALQQSLKEAPYIALVPAPLTVGEHRIRVIATDFYKNTSKAETSILVTHPPAEVASSAPLILSPDSNATFVAGQSVPVQILFDSDTLGRLQDFALAYKSKDGVPRVITQFKNVTARLPRYTLIWPDIMPGNYDLYLKATLKDGTVRFSSKVPVLAR